MPGVVNSNLATNVYNVPVPAGANATTFVQTQLPSDQRSGIVTMAAFIASQAGADRESLVHRALNVKNSLLCLVTPPPPDGIGDQIAAARAQFEVQTGQEQAAYRASIPLCKGCHGNFDSYGLVLDPYYQRAVPLLSGAVVLVFLVLCANVCSLLLARLTGRRREFAMC